MTKLDCCVTGCAHNMENCCCKSRIVVEGGLASDSRGTYCGSFAEKKSGMFRNLFKTPEAAPEVVCEAVNCVYNTDHFCRADHIGIDGRNAGSAVQTECSGFRMR